MLLNLMSQKVNFVVVLPYHLTIKKLKFLNFLNKILKKFVTNLHNNIMKVYIKKFTRHSLNNYFCNNARGTF